MVLTASVVRAFGQGIAQPSLQTECLHKLGAGKAGVASSTYYLGCSLGQGMGPLLGGKIAANWGYGAMFAVAAFLMFAGIGVYWLYRRYEP